MGNIYEITADVQRLQDALEVGEDCELELTEKGEELQLKILAYWHVYKNLEVIGNGLKAEIQRMKDRLDTIDKAMERIKATIYEAMIKTDMSKFEQGTFKFSIVKNGGKLPIKWNVRTDMDGKPIVAELPENFPKDCLKTTVTVDNTAVRKYIDETGDMTFAEYEERGTRLSVR